MAARLAGFRIAIAPRRGEYPLPTEVRGPGGRVGRQRAGQGNAPAARREITRVKCVYAFELRDEWCSGRLGEHGDAILAALAAPHPDFPLLQVDVLDPQRETLGESQARVVEQHRDQLRVTAQ